MRTDKHDVYSSVSNIVNCYSIYDEKAALYLQPFFYATHGQAIRAFGEMCLDPKMTANKYPEDFRLYYVGKFEQSSGIMLPLEKPAEYLASAIDYVRKVVPVENGLNEAGKHYVKNINHIDEQV